LTNKIKTYKTSEFREKYLDTNSNIDRLFKPNYENFFCLKIEDVKYSTKFPVPPSKETCHTLIFITNGIYKHKIGFNELTAKEGELICTAAGQIFSIDDIHKNLNGFTCHFHSDILIGKFGNKDLLNHFEFLKVWGNPHIVLNESNSKFVLNLFNRIFLEYTANGIKNIELIQAYLFALLAEINNNYKANSIGNYSSAISITNKFKEALFSSKAQKKVSEYASELNITTNHLNKSVKSVTGKSPAKWIISTIVTEAKYLLYQTNLTISEIAQEVGHFDQSYFSRLFKKTEGVTPQEFRKLIEKS
jgi:AraC family transcriptional regulator, transcriptional activator of pobA